MKFSLFREYGARNSKPVFDAFEKSLIAAGHRSLSDDMHTDVAVIWSVLWNGRMVGNKPIWDYFRKTGRNVIVLEVGGLQRGTTWKVGLNGINRDAYFSPTGNNDSRANQLGLDLKPWRSNGGPIYICCQHNKSLQWANMPATDAWVSASIDTIRQHTDREIIVRPHPRCPLVYNNLKYKDVSIQQPQLVKGSYDDYDLQYKNAWSVVNWSSNPGVQAVREGVPAFVGQSSLAHNVASEDLTQIENPLMPDRQQWINDLAHTEYTIAEIAQGIPLNNLTQYM
tara:strand:+ start:1491 stop:2336 length:846 start_codon:yes stop_codon:yes gene_type:complete